jgi:hypothetical protein
MMQAPGKNLLESRLRMLDDKMASTEQRAAALDIWINLRCDALPPSHLLDALAAMRAQIRALQTHRCRGAGPASVTLEGSTTRRTRWPNRMHVPCSTTTTTK